MGGTIKVLLVDDHVLVRRGFRRVLEDEPGITVVGEAGDGAQAVQMARELNPGVVLMDCSLPGLNGLFAAGQIVRSCPFTAVLMCSMHSEERWVRGAIEAGARGYLHKSATDLQLTSAIQRVVAGEFVFAPDFIELNGTTAQTKCPLSAREMEVLQLIVEGKSNKEIAVSLAVGASTVAAHRNNIMNTLRVHKTALLIVYAIRNGLACLP